MSQAVIAHCEKCACVMPLTDDPFALGADQATTCAACRATSECDVDTAVDGPILQDPLGAPLSPVAAIPAAGPTAQSPALLEYATPNALAHDRGLIGFDGVALVMAKNLVAPDRCVKCNAPAQGYQLLRRVHWHHPALYLLLFKLPLYLLVALMVRKTAKVSVGLCPVHRSARRRDMVIASMLCLVGPVILFGSAIFGAQAGGREGESVMTLGMMGGLVMFMLGLLVSIKKVPVVAARRIDDHYVYLAGAGRPFLDSLPRM